MESWLDKYLKLLSDKPDMKEYQWRYEMVPLLLEKGLGYPKNNIDFEKDRADVRISDDSDIPHIVFETKLSESEIHRTKVKKQALSYCMGGESFVVLASPKCWLIYPPDGEASPEDIHFDEDEEIINPGAFEKLKYEYISRRFEDFKAGESTSGFIKLRNRENFDKLIVALKKSHSLLYSYAGWVWPKLNQRYAEYIQKKGNLDQSREHIEHNVTHIAAKAEKLQFIEQDQRKLEREYEVEIEAVEKSYPTFKKIQPYSRDVKENQTLEIYLKEACYLALNRALMIRILEDKKLLKPKISRKGIDAWRKFTTLIAEEYQYLLRFSFWDAEKIYHHFFQEGPYGWYLKTDSELGDVMLKVFYLLNAFDFSELDREALKALYQKYYDPDERKKLGEFYTPPKVVSYLLNAVGWPGEGKLLDFACGSGGFLVEALKLKLDDMDERGLSAEAQWREAGSIYGLDINPFAAHIAEMNLLFLLIDKFRQAMDERKAKGEQFTLPDLNIFTMDALLDGRERKLKETDFSQWPGERYSDAIFVRDFQMYRYIAGNPPYVRNERLSEQSKRFYDEIFADFKEGNTDIFAYFLQKGMDWLEDGGRMGLIVSQGLADSKATAKVRRFLENYSIEEIVPLEWAEVFKFASVNPFLIVVKKEKPKPNHKIRIRQGLRSLNELAEEKGSITEVVQGKWKDIAPDGSWRLEITGEDLPILKKLKRYPKPFSGQYGMTLRGKEILISENKDNMKNPQRILDGREIRAWSIEWQGRYVDYDLEKISDPKSEEFFKNTDTILQRLSLTTQAVVFENDFYFRDTIMSVNCGIELSNYLKCGFINNMLNRYYTFFILRLGVLEGSKRSTFYPRVIKNFIVPPEIEEDKKALNKLDQLSRDCHSIAHEMVNGDRELSDWIEAETEGRTRYFSTCSDTNLASFEGTLQVENAYFDNGGRLVDGGLFHVDGDRERLIYILQHSALEGKDELTRKEIEDFPIPENGKSLKEINLKIAEWLERKPSLAGKLRENEGEIDRIVLEACRDLTDQERETIIRRCGEFPLSEVIQTPLPGKPTKRIKVKTYIDRYK